MIIGLFVLSILLVFIYVTFMGVVVYSNGNDYNVIAIIGAFVILAILAYIGITISNIPKAIDVYQGKTTLEYTIVDGEKVDSVVIWKQ